jgi:hypothetical protein
MSLRSPMTFLLVYPTGTFRFCVHCLCFSCHWWQCLPWCCHFSGPITPNTLIVLLPLRVLLLICLHGCPSIFLPLNICLPASSIRDLLFSLPLIGPLGNVLHSNGFKTTITLWLPNLYL